MSSKPDPHTPFELFSRKNALALSLALGVCLWQHRAWPCAALAVCDFALFFRHQRGAFTPRGNFGLGNTITSARAVLVLLLALPASSLSALGAAALALLVLTLDGVDGFVARKRGEASPFGAHFDMETDALFVLMATLRLHLFEGYSAWVLTAGALRYAYVLALWFSPGSGREEPRSRLGRFAFLILALSLVLGLALPNAIGITCVALGTAVVSVSFARSFYFSYFVT